MTTLKHPQFLSLKYLLIIVLCFFVFKSYSKKYPGEYYTNDSDTISCKIDVAENPYYNDIIDNISCKYFVRIFELDSLKVFKANQIRGFCIKNPTYGNMFFRAITFKKENIFVENLAEGRLSLYRYVYRNSYDWSIEYRDLVKKGDTYTLISILSFKTSFSPLVEDNDEIYKKVMNRIYKNENILEVIRLYNSSF
ncbi:MAG: hypothetical protein WCI92_01835 [Bacteroidota bacterium]